MLDVIKTNALRFFSILAFLALGGPAPAQPEAGVITNAAEVISLSAERAASRLKVAIKGVVTAADPALKGRFFVQDSTGGVFVDNANGQRPEPGDVV